MYLFTLVVPRRKPFPSFLPNPAPSLSASLSLSLVSSGRKLAARSNLRLVTPSTSDNGGVCPALAARNARREKINNGDPHHGLIRQEIPPPFFHETGISAIIQVVRVFSNGYARTRAKWNLLSSRPLLLYCSRCTFHSFPRNSPRLLLSFEPPLTCLSLGSQAALSLLLRVILARWWWKGEREWWSVVIVT